MNRSYLITNLAGLPRNIKRSIIFIFDVNICIISTWISFKIILNPWTFFYGNQWIALFVALFLSLTIFVSQDFYRAIFRHIGIVAINQLLRAYCIYWLIYLTIFTIIDFNDVPRLIGILQPLFYIFFIASSRYLIRLLFDSNLQKNSLSKSNVLIYGAGSAGRQLVGALFNSSELIVKGFIDDSKSMQGNTINGLKIYSPLDIKKIISKHQVNEILLALPSANYVRRNRIISSLEGCGAKVRTVPGLGDIAAGKVSLSKISELDVNDLIGRELIYPKDELLGLSIQNKTVMVTGAGGSIGGELCRQILQLKPSKLILVEHSENALYLIYEEIVSFISNFESTIPHIPTIKIFPYLASVQNRSAMEIIFNLNRPNTVFHAAAYKHVSLVEENPIEGFRNNFIGTLVVAELSKKFGVDRFSLISTDKAVRPTSFMGMSKRVSEMLIQSLSQHGKENDDHTTFSIVRFGNVLGSSGSVVPIFRQQIKEGGPITLTHPDVTRFFMTIPEAVQLVIQSSAMASGGEIFLLDMGEPVRIGDLARKMVYLSGLTIRDALNPGGDIEINISGLRPGEKLYEELLIDSQSSPTSHPRIMRAFENFMHWSDFELQLNKIIAVLEISDLSGLFKIVIELVPEYSPSFKVVARV